MNQKNQKNAPYFCIQAFVLECCLRTFPTALLVLSPGIYANTHCALALSLSCSVQTTSCVSRSAAHSHLPLLSHPDHSSLTNRTINAFVELFL